MSEAWIDTFVEAWLVETARSFNERGLDDPELEVALQEAFGAIRQVLAVEPTSPSSTPVKGDYTTRPG